MKIERAPAFQFYAKDWRDVKVRRMTLAAQGAYIAILADMWIDSKDQCSILNHHPFLACALGVSMDEFEVLFKEIQNESEPLFEELDGRLYSRRLQQESTKKRKFAKEQKKRADSRWAKQAMPDEYRIDAGLVPEPCSSSSSSSLYQTSLSPPNPRKDSTEKREAKVGESHAVTANEILTKWNAIVGVKPCRKITGDLLARVNRLCKEHPISWWSDLFASIGRSKFLTGGVEARSAQGIPFRASLSWVVGPKNLSKIEAGDYEDSGDTSGATSMTCQVRIKKEGFSFLKPCGDSARQPARGEILKPICQKHFIENQNRHGQNVPAERTELNQEP